MDFDPRDYDSRDEDRAPTRDRGGRGGSGRDDERDDEWSRPAAFPRDRDDEGGTSGAGLETRANRIPQNATVMLATMPAGRSASGTNARATPIPARCSRVT